MKNTFTKYDQDTGEILCVFKTTTENAKRNGPCIEGEYHASEYRIINGVPVRKDDAEIESAAVQRAWVELRKRRLGLLQDSDWTQVPDAPVDQAAWAAYRQELRDLPSKTEDPRNPAWPTPPA